MSGERNLLNAYLDGDVFWQLVAADVASRKDGYNLKAAMMRVGERLAEALAELELETGMEKVEKTEPDLDNRGFIKEYRELRRRLVMERGGVRFTLDNIPKRGEP